MVSTVPSRVSLLIYILRLNMVLTYGIPPEFRGGVHIFKKNMNASKPSEHPPSGGKMSEGLGGDIGCIDKTSSWYQTGSPM